MRQKRYLEDFDRVAEAVGLATRESELKRSLRRLGLPFDPRPYFHLDHMNDTDERLKAVFKFCGLDEKEPRHWRALLNAFVTTSFPRSGRPPTRHQVLLELLFE